MQRTLRLLAFASIFAVAGCDDLMSGFDNPNAYVEEPLDVEGEVTDTLEGRAFVFAPAKDARFLADEIIVFIEKGELPVEGARVRVEGRIQDTTASELRKRLAPNADTSLGRYDTKRVIMADEVVSLSGPS